MGDRDGSFRGQQSGGRSGGGRVRNPFGSSGGGGDHHSRTTSAASREDSRDYGQPQTRPAGSRPGGFGHLQRDSGGAPQGRGYGAAGGRSRDEQTSHNAHRGSSDRERPAARGLASGPALQQGKTYQARVVELTASGFSAETSDGTVATVPGFRWNAAEQRAFAVDDELEIICARVESTAIACPSARFVRPLLILDINGVLGAREAYSAKDRNKKRRFVLRESAKEFLSFARRHFEVAVWSCSTKENLRDDLRVLCGDESAAAWDLCFVWDQDKSTNLWPRSSIVNDKKPLFLKELSRVWEAVPCFSAVNTVLVDNHEEKFERNPLGTCVRVPEWAPGSEDGLLDPGSELWMHLEAMACTGDCGAYMRDRAGTSDLFLEAYPRPPPEAVSAKPVDPSALRMQFLTQTRHADEIDYWLRQNELPSTRALTLRRSSLRQMLASCDFTVCEKTDGVRYCLVASAAEGRVFLLDRAMEVRDFAVDADLAGWLRTRAGDTVLDGELVLDLTTQASMFVVFDAIVVDGERTGLFHSFARRLRCAEAWLDGALTAGLLPFDVIMKTQVPCEMLGEVRARLTAAEHGWVYEDGTCRHHSDGLIFTPANVSYYVCMPFKWKPTALMTVDFSVAMSDLANKQGPVTGNVKTFESFPPACDVVVDRSEPWVRELLTGSRSVASVILECLFVPEEGAWRAVKHRDDKNVPNSLRTAFSTLEAVAEGLTLDELVDSFELKAGARHSEKQGADAVDKLSSYTHLTLRALQGQGSKTRGDRSYIMQEQSVAAPERPPAVHSKAQTQTQTQDRREPPRPPTATTTTATTAAVSSQVVAAAPLVIEAEVGSHYDRIQRERWQGGKGSLDAEIAVLRKLQNWNKACMIKRLDSSQFDGRGDLEALLADLDVSFDVAGIAPMQAPLTGRLNAPNTQSRIPRRVLDLACGRGGDLVKWTRDCLINAYVGVDISAEELREAAQRAETLERGGDRPPSFHFHRSSCDAPSLLTELYALVNSRNPGSLDARAHRDQALSGFNVVWCQFALHYFCGSRESLDGFLKNVAGALGRGGRFCASFPNPSAIVGHLNHIAQTGEARSGSKVCYVSTDTPRSIGSEEALREFGLAYKFTLGDAVQDCVEFLVPLEALVSLASAVGLRLVRLQQMHAFMSRCAHDPELAALREVMQVVGPKSPGRLLSEHEWQAIGLYCVAVFERV